MKLRILLPSVALLGLAVNANAQIPNGSFENWMTPTGATYQDPVGWITFNGLTSLAGASPSCEQGSPGAVGNYYANLTTRNTAFGLIAGIIISGDGTTGTSGFAYNSRPAALTGQWQYGIQPLDTGMVIVYFTKWNATTQSSDSIGGGFAPVLGSHSGWTPLNIPITYFSSANPDTAIVGVFSSMNSPVEGSFIKIDALGFGVSTGVAETADAAEIGIYPSPATNVVNVVADQPIAEVDLLDMTGRIVLKQSASAKSAIVDIADLNSGRYLVQLRMADGTRQVRSMVKQ